MGIELNPGKLFFSDCRTGELFPIGDIGEMTFSSTEEPDILGRTKELITAFSPTLEIEVEMAAWSFNTLHRLAAAYDWNLPVSNNSVRMSGGVVRRYKQMQRAVRMLRRAGKLWVQSVPGIE